MKINSSLFDPLRPDRGNTAQPSGASRNADPTSSAPASQPASRSDSVQISDSARTLASRAQAESSSRLDPERVAELRKKVLDGAYNTLDVVDQVARRILSRGDL